MGDVQSETLSKLQELLGSEDGARSPSKKELLEMLEQSDMDEELKGNLRSMLSGNAPQLFGSSGGGTWLAILFVVLIVAVLRKFECVTSLNASCDDIAWALGQELFDVFISAIDVLSAQ
ncbi:unnamed protein product, partial [Iphiclides podalirius]